MRTAILSILVACGICASASAQTITRYADADGKAVVVTPSSPLPTTATIADAPIISSTGTIDANGEQVALDTPEGAGSAIITVSGTFVGEIEVVGSSTTPGAPAVGRILFKSGVGSISTNSIIGTGAAINREYRIVPGDQRIIVRAIAWTSGSISVRIAAQKPTNVVFINGLVHTADQEAVRDRRAFVASTGVQAVASGSSLYFTFANPANSGVNVILTGRTFGSNSTTPLEYQAYANPTAVLSSTASSINRWLGATPGWSVLKYQVSTGITMGGTLGTGGVIGEPLNFEVVITPGSTLGFVIQGAGTNLTNAARIYARLIWYEESVN